MALFAFAAIGTLQSCKDDVSDLRIQTTYDVSNLKSQLVAMQGNLQQQITANKNKADKNEADILQLRQDLADYATIAYVDGLIGDKSQIPAGGLVEMITGAISRIDGLANALGTENDPVTANTVYGKLNALKAGLDAINDAFAGSGFNDMADLLAQTKQLLADFDQLKNTDFPALKTKVDDLETAMDEINGRFDKLVTGILIQGTDNPLFGNFSLPIGVKSNMLFNWYGKSEVGKTYAFPTDVDAFSADNNAISEDALTALNPKSVEIKKGQLFGNGGEKGISLGKVYLTINPTNVDFNETKFTLETSAGNKLEGYDLTVTNSDRELAFGYNSSRAEEEKAPNGFYEAEVFMPATEEAIAQTDLGITQALENAMNDVVAGGSKKTAAIDILKKIYDLMSGQLKAYGVRYDWDYKKNNKDVYAAVLSQYDLAVATATPLGFNFMEGKGISRKVPTFGNVDNFLQRIQDKINGKFTFKNKNITVKGKSVAIESIEIEKINTTVNASGQYDPAGPGRADLVRAVVKGLKIGNVVKADLYTDPTNEPSEILEMVNTLIRETVVETISGRPYSAASDELKAEADIKIDAVLLQMQNEVNSAINDITARATSTVNNAFNKVRNHSERLQQLVDLYNKVANKVSDVLANPNDYLQVAAFYKTNDGFGILSNDPYSPTQMTEGSGLHLMLTTYTAELIAPAYKKYIAVTAVNSSTTGIADLNYGEILNTVLDGTQVNASIPVEKWQKGSTYELTYQAVDYTGRTSTRKFYITVI